MEGVLDRVTRDPRHLLAEAYVLAGLPEPSRRIPVKEEIRGLLQRLGFSSYEPDINATHVMHLKAGQLGELAGFVESAFSQNMGVTMRLSSASTKELPGGLVTVNLTEDKLEQLLGSEQIHLTTVEGDTILMPNDPATVELFLRKPSSEAFVSGFSGRSEAVETKLGGGFRIALEKIEPVDDPNTAFLMKLKVAYSFGDSSPRKIGIVPTGNLEYELPIVRGGMVLPKSITEDSSETREEIANAIKKGIPLDATTITRYMTDRFLEAHYHSTVRALLLAYSQLPQPLVSQIEGKWGIQPAFPKNNVTPLLVATDLEGPWTVAGVLSETGKNPFYTSTEELRMNFLALQRTALKEILPSRVGDDLVNAANRAYLRSLRVSIPDR